ncbi:MAG: BamA/TamA family outer membrane protein [Gemmatimonadaceae bacterium]
MRIALVAGALALASASLAAQVPDSARRDSARVVERGMPREAALDAAARFNRPAALRASGSLVIPAEQVVSGDVAVLHGPLTVAGHVRGGIVAINGDVFFQAGARVDGDVIVAGGLVDGERSATIGGALRVYGAALAYRKDGDLIVAEPDEEPAEGRAARWTRRFARPWSTAKISLTTGGVYNRVEGLPIYLGPLLEYDGGSWGARVAAYGILRTSHDIAWDGENLGHDATGELRLGNSGKFSVGGRLFDVVEGVETWQLKDTEVGLAALFLRRDFRDYYTRHGAAGYVRLFDGRALGLTLSYSDERWGTRDVRDPLSVFRNNSPWRPNPALDEGRFRIAGAAVTLDTRNDEDDPWSGWLVSADVERGASRAATLAPVPTLARAVIAGRTPVTYTRAFLDARRYNRVSPGGQLNLRAVLGGWVGGDPLPLQRRFSMGGVGSLPGFDFRDATGPDAAITCGGRAQRGRPALCERVALVQAEYRGDLHFTVRERNPGRVIRRAWRRWVGFDRTGQWVLFADAGRGWLVGSERIGTAQYERGALPPLRTVQTDIGGGLDFQILGFFVAKSTSRSNEKPNFFVRLRHRF